MKLEKNRNPKDSKVYLVGSGMASLASAVYLVKDAGVPGENIHILEKDLIPGGASDGAGDEEKGFVVRFNRMHEINYVCFWDLLSSIPSLEDPSISVRDESFDFSRRFVSNAQARLLKEGKKIDVSSYGLDLKHQAQLLKLTFASEKSLEDMRIEDYFDQEFFKTNFWLMGSSMFAFQRWSSVAEMRRYIKRFIHLVDGLNRLGDIIHTKYSQYHSVILPLKNYLTGKGVVFDFGREVIDIDFNLSEDRKTAKIIYFKNGDKIALGENDYVFITNGSPADSADNGAWDRPPKLKGLADSGSWQLWKKLAARDKAFGNPAPFCDKIDRHKLYSFTGTLKDSTFHDYMENFSGNVDGTGGLVTLTDSNWLMSFVIPRQPHFPNQPGDARIFWGYGLKPDKKGNFIYKTMAECTGKEILEELWHSLKIQDLMKPVMESGKANCIPVALPYADSLFMPRETGDRPEVLPKGAANFAFLGQFAEAPKDCVFTVEYSVRTAQMAVYGLFETGKEVIPVYDSIHHPEVLINAVKAISR